MANRSWYWPCTRGRGRGDITVDHDGRGNRLKDYISEHSDVEAALRSWWRVVQTATWHDFSDVRQTYNSAGYVDPYIVFNIKGNDYRLVTYIDFEQQYVVMKWFGTHAEYDNGQWKR